MTNHTLPFNWGWHQNPNIAEEFDPVTGKSVLTNSSRLVKPKMEYLNHYMESVPQGPSRQIPDDPPLQELINELTIAYNERPIWTRRAVINRVSHSSRLYLIREALPYIGYRFKGGPFRDAIIKYGVDPRKDRRFRKYQTLYFVLQEEEDRVTGTPWQDPRTAITISKKTGKKTDATTHLFDGKNLTLDGRLFQMCDVTDPLLARLIRDAPVRQEFEPEYDGWFYNGSIAKIKGIMKAKLLALRNGKEVEDEDFKAALETPDIVPNRLAKQIAVPVPNMKLTASAIQKLRESRGKVSKVSGMQKRGYIGPLRPRPPRVKTSTTKETSAKGLLSTRLKSKSKTPGEGVSAAGRKQSVTDPLDPRLLADQEQEEDEDPRFGIGEDGGGDVPVGRYERHGGRMDDEMEDSEKDEDETDLSDDSDGEGSEIEELEGSGNEDSENGEAVYRGSADSIDFMRFYEP
jgi:general transcription factor 3C polypeptide 5 (transcription factor C subunit 1)